MLLQRRNLGGFVAIWNRVNVKESIGDPSEVSQCNERGGTIRREV